MITIKSDRELLLMKEAGRIVAECHEEVKKILKPGVTTKEIDDMVAKTISANGGSAPTKGYHGFPASCCTSVNDQVVHGIPSSDIVLSEGDIITVDIVASYKGYIGDSAWTYPIGKIDDESTRLLEECERALFVGLEQVKEGIHLSDVSYAIMKHANDHNLGIVREMSGHGVGKSMHEDPQILNYGTPGNGPILKSGMTLAIEPMLNLGCDEIDFHDDGWTTTTRDKKRSAHFEHTIVVTNEGYEILTKL